jgi:hypothetical protein
VREAQTAITAIVIVGTGRCGSTVLHHILSHHPQTAWLSRWCDKYPDKPQVNRLAMRALDLPLPSRYIRKVLYPVEAYRFWEHHCPGFSEPCRDLNEEDVSPKIKRNVQEVMLEMSTDRRNTLLIKITGWPRIGFLKEIFPDAKFIHIYRDGRAVVNSWLNVGWWSGWRGPANWRWGELTYEQREKWTKHDRSFVALAAIEWEILMTAQERAKQRIPPSDLLEIRYEDLCQAPVETLREVTEFSALKWSPRFEAAVKGFSLESANDKWRTHLSDVQKNAMRECLEDTLKKYGYSWS